MGYSMEFMEVDYSLLNAINGAVSSFNVLFNTIAPITLTEDDRGISNQISIEPTAVTSRQSSEIQQLSNYLANLRDQGQRSVLLHNRAKRLQITQLAPQDYAQEEIIFLKNKIKEIQAEDVKKAKMIATLTTFLINETNRASDIEKMRSIEETMLVEMTVLRDDYKKSYRKQLSINSELKKRGMEQVQKYRKMLSIFVNNRDGSYFGKPDTPSSSSSSTSSDIRNSEYHKNVNIYTDIDDNCMNECFSPIPEKLNQRKRKELLGVYIRKQFEDDFFFGLIVLYEKPFYKVGFRKFQFSR